MKQLTQGGQSSDASAAKISRQSEFQLDRTKTVPALYKGMNMDGLLNHSSMDPHAREWIALHRWCELYQLDRADDLSTMKAPSLSVEEVLAPLKPQHPKTKPALFQLLYTFGQYYSQVFPEKSAAILEYLHWLTRYGQTLSLPVLIMLDNSVRKFYIERPLLNWDVTNANFRRFYDDAKLIQERVDRVQARSVKQNAPAQHNYQPNFQQRKPTPHSQNYQNQGWGGGGQRHSQAKKGAFPPGDPCHNRCINWNTKGCVNDPRCFRQHVCLDCGDSAHKQDQCPKKST